MSGSYLAGIYWALVVLITLVAVIVGHLIAKWFMGDREYHGSGAGKFWGKR